jgi:hypothetical protein
VFGYNILFKVVSFGEFWWSFRLVFHEFLHPLVITSRLLTSIPTFLYTADTSSIEARTTHLAAAAGSQNQAVGKQYGE